MDARSLDATIRNVIRSVLSGTSQDAAPAVPIGAVVLWPGPQAKIPRGYLEAAGQNVKIADYPMLYQLYGTTYNSGTPGGSFRLPNYGTVADSATATVGRYIIRYV